MARRDQVILTLFGHKAIKIQGVPKDIRNNYKLEAHEIKYAYV